MTKFKSHKKFFGRSGGDPLIVERPTGWSKWDRVLSKCQLISHEEQCNLVAQAQAGCEISFDKVVKSCLLLVVPVAKHYFKYNRPNSPLTLMDYIQYGNEGLVKAVHKFNAKYNPQKKSSFASYAMYYIRGIILTSAFKEMDFVRIPANPGGERNLPIEIASLDEFIQNNQRNRENEYEETYLDTLKVNDYSPDNDLMIKDFRLNIKLWFSAKLSFRECKVLELYFLHERQLEEIGDLYGITKESIR
ncbi:MAG: polymerase primary sigma factor, partial [Bacteroidota bacterium]|nr:polymerase primary sigma factor [Bacteroidota bacterium]